MYVIEYYVKDAIDRIDGILKYKNSKSFEPKNYKNTITNIMLNLFNTFSEATEMLNFKSHMANRIYNFINDLDNFLEDKDKFIRELEYFQYELDNIDLCRLYYRDYSQSYSFDSYKKRIDEKRYKEIFNCIKFPLSRPINVLDTECYTNKALEYVKEEYKDDVLCYGITSNGYFNYSSALDRYIVSDSDNRMYVSNNAFDVLIHSPNLSIDFSKHSFLLTKKEKNSIKNSLKYLRSGGAYFLIISSFRLYSDICSILVKELEDIEVYSLTENNYYNYTFPVVIKGIKRKERLNRIDGDNNKTYNLLRTYPLKCRDFDYLFEVGKTIDFKPIHIPDKEIEIKYFRGTYVTDRDVKNIFDKSNCIEQVIKQQKEIKTTYDKSPLVPFALGQIGLVLSSGCVDGSVDEQNGCYHLIKGRIVKDETDEDNVDNNTMCQSKTTRNKVEINALFANGTYKKLI